MKAARGKIVDKIPWKKLWLFDKKEKPLQEVFFKKEIPCKTKEEVFQKKKKMEIPQEKAI